MAPLATYVKNRQGRYLEVNPAALRLLGREKHEVLGKTDLEILPREAAEVLRNGDKQVLETGKEVSYDAEVLLRGIRVFLSTVTYPLFDAEQRVNAICGLIRDVTLQKETEAELTATREYLQNILDNSPVIIVTTDLDSRIVSFNRGAEASLGYSAEEVIGRHASELYRDPEDRLPLAQGVEKHGFVQDFETKLVRKDGSDLPVSITLSQLKDTNGNPIGLVGISRDISKRKALMNQIVQADRMAAVGRLAAGVAHEINNPLAVIAEIAGYLEDMLTGEVDSDSETLDREIREGLPKIAMQVSRCRSITRRLLSFARKTEARVEIADVCVALDEILPFLEKEAHLASIKVHRSYPRDLPPVSIEEVQLEEIFINLIKNAIQALGPEGGGNIWVGAELADDRVIVSVEDDGPGIPEEARSKIFDPFFSTKAQGEGTGLGLSICYGIVKRYDGEIRVDSEPGKGARFRVILKVHRAPAPENEPLDLSQ
jgi:PAS domain S-box-containing protein